VIFEFNMGNMRLPRRFAPRNDSLFYEIAALRSQRRISASMQ
jgi:hypothetical protein